MLSTTLYFLCRDLTKKFFQSYFDRLDNTYQDFTHSTNYSIRLRLFNYGQHCELSNFGQPDFTQLLVVEPEVHLWFYLISENIDFFIIHFFLPIMYT